MPRKYMQNAHRVNNRQANHQHKAAPTDRRRADQPVRISIPIPRSGVADIESALAWDWILGDRA